VAAVRVAMNSYARTLIKNELYLEQLLSHLVEDVDNSNRAYSCRVELLLQVSIFNLENPKLLGLVELRGLEGGLTILINRPVISICSYASPCSSRDRILLGISFHELVPGYL
jgi:hypothetical protein